MEMVGLITLRLVVETGLLKLQMTLKILEVKWFHWDPIIQETLVRLLG